MKKWFALLAVVLSVSIASIPMDAQAKRLGGGRSIGMQRQVAPPAKTPQSTPAQAPAAAPSAAPGAAAASTRSKWMGPLAGLAAGLGLAALAAHFGFGAAMANVMLILLLLLAAGAALAFFMRRKAAQHGRPLAYAGVPAGSATPRHDSAAHVLQPNAFKRPSPAPESSIIGSALGGGQASAPAANIPADFDVENFVRHAKVNFMRLQAANDAGNLEDIRQFTTPEMFAEIGLDMRERGNAVQRTEVLDLHAEVLDVAQEGALYLVSVRFTGRVREDAAEVQPINEIWHLSKPRYTSGGWMLAGIEQSQ